MIDISDPSRPRQVGQYNSDPQTYWDASAVAVAGSHVYVANAHIGVQIINIADPTIPVLAGTADMGRWASAEDVAVSGHYAYLVDGGALKILDVSDPRSPVQRGPNVAVSYSTLAVSSNRLFTSGQIFDITTNWGLKRKACRS